MRGPRSLVAVLAIAIGAVSCGYALAGRGNALPAHIRTVGIPNLVNHSNVPEIDVALSDAVRAEFSSRGRYVVQPVATGVDAVLTGIVVSAELRPLTFTANNQASSYTLTITTSVEFKDLIDDKVLWTNPAFRSSEEYQAPASAGVQADLNTIFTQAPNAQVRLAKKFAREVVSSIFEAF
jgi:hypothetical protein